MNQDENQQNNTSQQGNLNINSTNQNTGNRNEVQFYGAGFPQLNIIGYGVIQIVAGPTVVFDELATAPIMSVVHQPNYTASAGWTIAYAGVGLYTLTHNLGHKKYLVVLNVVQASAAGTTMGVSTMTSTLVNITARNAATGALENPDAFSYVIYGIPSNLG